MVWLIVILVVVALLLLGLVLLYNRFVQLRNRVDNSWAQIEVQLKRRWDLIPNLVETVRGYAEHERGTFEAVTEARAQRAARERAGRDGGRRGDPRRGARRLFAVAEAYPELQADENFRQLQDELAGTENRIAVSRQVYNDTVLTYNNAIQTFPGVVLAGPFGFSRREFFETDDDAARGAAGRLLARRGLRRRDAAGRSVRPARRPRPGGAPVGRRRRRRSRRRRRRPQSRRGRPGADLLARLGDVQVEVRPDGAVAVDEQITVAFSGAFTYGYREIPLRQGERIDEIARLRERKGVRAGRADRARAAAGRPARSA